VLNDGAAPTIIQFAGTSLGGFVEVSVAGSTIDYDSIANLNTAVGGTAVITA
jgi:NADH:ubiquinone oxidoreductase subunit F (NADH-binding)